MTVFRQSTKEPLYDLNVKSGSLCISDLLDNCCICHPTVMFRAASINGKEKFRYDKQMAYAEDYDLWMRMLASGKKFVNLDKVVTYYRLHEQQVTTCHHEEQAQKTQIIRAWALKKQIELEKKAFQEPAFIPDTTNKLTVVMPFKNEGEEVANTAKSIRDTVGMSVDIVAIDDDCDDGFDYVGSLRGLNVTFGDITLNACRRNPKCKNGECANPECSNQCTINYCGLTTPTAAPSGSPTPTVTTLCISF